MFDFVWLFRDPSFRSSEFEGSWWSWCTLWTNWQHSVRQSAKPHLHLNQKLKIVWPGTMLQQSKFQGCRFEMHAEKLCAIRLGYCRVRNKINFAYVSSVGLLIWLTLPNSPLSLLTWHHCWRCSRVRSSLVRSNNTKRLPANVPTSARSK